MGAKKKAKRASREAVALIDELVDATRTRTRRQLTELSELGEQLQTLVERTDAQLRTAADDAEANLRAASEQTDAALRAVVDAIVERSEQTLRTLVERAESHAADIETARAQALSETADLSEQLAARQAEQTALLDRQVAAHQEALDSLESATHERLATASELAASQIADAVDEHLRALELAHTDALHRIHEREEERLRFDAEAAEPLEASTDGPGHAEDEREEEQDAEAPEDTPPEPTLADLDDLDDLDWEAPPEPEDAPLSWSPADPTPDPNLPPPAPESTNFFAAPPVTAPVTAPPVTAPPVTAPVTASAHLVPDLGSDLGSDLGWPATNGAAATTTLAPARPRGNPTVVHASRAQLVASLSQLVRTAADGWLRVQLVHGASQGQGSMSLRLTVNNIGDGWEYHELPVRNASGNRQPTTVDARELLQALDHHQTADDTVEITADGDLTVGTVLVLGRNVAMPVPSGERRKVERIELQPCGRDGLHLDTLLGRLVVSSLVVSSLRSRRATDIDLVTISDQPCLSARVPGPTPDVVAVVVAPLHAEATDVTTDASPDRRMADESPISQLVGALSTGSSPDELVAIIAQGVGYARRRAAANPALPEGVIADVLRDGTEAMRAAAASNPSIPVSSIERAATDSAPVVRAAVAGNPNVPASILFRLTQDESTQVRIRVAGNPALPPEMLALLADDPDARVRATVAAHTSCPVEKLTQLAGDSFPAVCANVADNPHCPIELLDQLLSVVPEVVLSNPRAPEQLLVAGTQVGVAKLRAAVAANPSTPARELQTLARDPDRMVVRALASNPNAPASVRRKARRRSERTQSSRDGQTR